jgi:hypothetical protein
MAEVTMQDGTKVEFGERAKVIKRSTITTNGIEVKFLYKDGTVKTALMPLDHSLLLRAAQHGLDQKFGDANSGLDDIEDMQAGFDELAEQVLTNGIWAEKRVGEGLAGSSVLARALAQVTGKPLDEVRAKLKNLTHAQKTALRNQPGPVADKVREIEAARAAKTTEKVDVAAALAVFN